MVILTPFGLKVPLVEDIKVINSTFNKYCVMGIGGSLTINNKINISNGYKALLNISGDINVKWLEHSYIFNKNLIKIL